MTGPASAAIADHWTRPYRRGLMQWLFMPGLFAWAVIWLAWVVVVFGAAGIRGDLGAGEMFGAACFVAFGCGFGLAAWRLGIAGVYVSDRGVKVRSLGWSRTLEWSDVVHFSVVIDGAALLRNDQLEVRLVGGEQLRPVYPARLACLGVGDVPARACEKLEAAREMHT